MCWHSFSLIAYRKGSAEHDWGSISIFIYLTFKCNTHLNHDAILPNEQTHPNYFYGYSSLMWLFPIWIIQVFRLFWFDVNIVLAVYSCFFPHFLWLIFQLTFRKNALILQWIFISTSTKNYTGSKFLESSCFNFNFILFLGKFVFNYKNMLFTCCFLSCNSFHEWINLVSAFHFFVKTYIILCIPYV